ncbi:hypothetical protein [Tropicimonas isoalkanivorans]|uniref:Uncharacterized protein n=1 Tax=Tropicimonas isoalkanivorans TaxID=441112 RepID=A0A1I1JG32_9RHOB|nr:hypothetical protein [Tropicimonas isoalkanivorans]SFC47426.1 hypothetical protein SAMN04488094_105107 [Tropicimonas isoalkanivorans]
MALPLLIRKVEQGPFTCGLRPVLGRVWRMGAAGARGVTCDVKEVLEIRIPRGRSVIAREVLERIAWRGYIPPEGAEGENEVIWHLPADQIDLIQSVMKRNRRQAGGSPRDWKEIDQVCEAIAEQSRRTGIRPSYGPDDVIP